jgi:hypothetical protein
MDLMKILSLMAVSLLLAGCEPAQRTVPTLLHPTALVEWRAGGGFLGASYSDSTVHFIDRGGTRSHPWAGDPSGRRLNVLRLALDERRGLLWAVGNDYVSVFRLPLGGHPPRLLARVGVPFSRVHPKICLPDIALDRDGRAYVTSTHGATITMVEPSGGRPMVQSLRFPPYGPQPWSLSALSFTPDGRFLLAADAATGTLWRIDLREFRAQRIEGGGELRGACGFAWLGAGSVLVSHGFDRGLSLLELSPDYLRATASGERQLDARFVFSVVADGPGIVYPVPNGERVALARAQLTAYR